jgi:hypothetical protein
MGARASGQSLQSLAAPATAPAIIGGVKTEQAGHTAVNHPSPTGLTIFWLEVLELAHHGNDAGVAERLAQLAMRREDLDEVFGGGAGSRLWGEYGRAFASFAGAGAREIAQKIRERRYDDVEVVPQPIGFDQARAPMVQASGGGGGAMQSGGGGGSSERLSADTLRTNAAVFSVRLKRNDETDGIRIDTFVFIDGIWRTALKVGRGSK